MTGWRTRYWDRSGLTEGRAAGYAYAEIRRSSLNLIEERNLDPEVDRGGARRLVEQAVKEYSRRTQVGRGRALRDPSDMIERVLRSIADYGPLTELLSRHDVEEVFIEGPRVTFIDGAGRLQGLKEPTTVEENRQVVDRLLAGSDRRLDVSQPIVQARVMGDSARLTAVIPPISDQLSVTLRRYALRRQSLDSLVELGSMPPAAARFLAAAMQIECGVVVSGPPGAGKTSLLSALLDSCPPTRCIRCCEEVRELHIPLVHGSFYEARPPGLDGKGEISLRVLVKAVLAMRPDLIVVGEVRGAEAFELTRAANAGCGFACTVHANSAADALNALVSAALMAGENVSERVVRRVFASAIDLVVHVDREALGEDRGGPMRQVREIISVMPGRRESFSTSPLFCRTRLGEPMNWVGDSLPGSLVSRIERATGVGLGAILNGEGPQR